VGGHCIGVDPYYLTYKAKELGYQSQVILAGRQINDGMANHIAQKVVQHVIKIKSDVKTAKVLVMGITFKENVSDIRNSKTAELVHLLKDYYLQVDVTDPHADNEELVHEYGFGLQPNVNETYDAIVVAVPHAEYKELEKEFWQNIRHEKTLLVDIKGILRNKVESEFYWSL